jgi:hypothetical protein
LLTISFHKRKSVRVAQAQEFALTFLEMKRVALHAMAVDILPILNAQPAAWLGVRLQPIAQGIHAKRRKATTSIKE